MNSPNHCRTRITGCFNLWLMVSLVLGMNYAAASANAAASADAKKSADGKAKIVMLKLKLVTETPQKQLQSKADILDQQPASTRIQLQRTIGKRSQPISSTQMPIQHSGNNIDQPVSRNQSSDASSPPAIAPQHNMEKKVETADIQKIKILEPQPPDKPTSSVAAEALPQPSMQEDLPARKINADILTTTRTPPAELTPKQESIHDKVAIITRILLKLSLITVCCITLFFSFSALQIAKSTHRK